MDIGSGVLPSPRGAAVVTLDEIGIATSRSAILILIFLDRNGAQTAMARQSISTVMPKA
jgi:hypothetical protein